MAHAQPSEDVSGQKRPVITVRAAVKLYELGRISSGRAAEFAGISRIEFLNCLMGFRLSDSLQDTVLSLARED